MAIDDAGNIEETERQIHRVDSERDIEPLKLVGEGEGEKKKKLEDRQAPEVSYAFFKGVNERDGLYVFKMLTRVGDPDFKRFEVGFHEDEYGRIFRQADPTWVKDPFLRKLPYFDNIREYHKKRKGDVVRWDWEEYNIWRMVVNEEEGANARIYSNGELKIPLKERSEGRSSRSLEDTAETDSPSGK